MGTGGQTLADPRLWSQSAEILQAGDGFSHGEREGTSGGSTPLRGAGSAPSHMGSCWVPLWDGKPWGRPWVSYSAAPAPSKGLGSKCIKSPCRVSLILGSELSGGGR